MAETITDYPARRIIPATGAPAPQAFPVASVFHLGASMATPPELEAQPAEPTDAPAPAAPATKAERAIAYQVARLQATSPEEQWAPMTDEQRASWEQTGLFPVEKWKKGADSTPLVCPMPTNEELRALASAVPEHLQLSGWYIRKPAFGHRYLYADNFRGMGRQWVCDFPSDKHYFGGLAEYVAAVHPRTVIRLLDHIAELEGQPPVAEAEPIYQYRHRNEVGELESERWMDCDAEEYARFAPWPEIERRIVYAAPATPTALTKAIWQRICELPDRNSPEDEPEACICTFEEFSACVEGALEGSLAASPAGQGEDARDAKRYRWLRERHWNESTLFVVAGHHSLVRLGTDCPSDDRLDAAIDAAMSASKEPRNA